MAQFDPFNDRAARDLRNALSTGMVEALRQGTDAPFTAALARAGELASAPGHREYINGRREIFSRVKDEIGPDAGPWEIACALWNHGAFFEVHEVMEDAWRKSAGAEREMLQAMIRAAGVMVHRAAGREEAAAKMAAKAFAVLDRLRDELPLAGPGPFLAWLERPDGAPPPLAISGRGEGK